MRPPPFGNGWGDAAGNRVTGLSPEHRGTLFGWPIEPGGRGDQRVDQVLRDAGQVAGGG
jgi:hypothetical protein